MVVQLGRCKIGVVKKMGLGCVNLHPWPDDEGQHVGSLNLGHGFFNLPLHPTESLSMSIPTERLEEKRQRGRARRSNQSVAVRQPVIFVIAIPHFRSELDKARRRTD